MASCDGLRHDSRTAEDKNEEEMRRRGSAWRRSGINYSRMDR
jgi:hypothetical protein